MPEPLYVEPALYELLFAQRQHDLPLYLGLAAERLAPASPVARAVLELGVGAGRVALPLARAGHSVVGIDSSAAMLARLRTALEREPLAVQERLVALQADATSVSLERRFALVTCPFNGLAHFHSAAELGALLQTVRRHLAPGGAWAFDVMVPEPAVLAGTSSWMPWLRHPRTGEVCRAEETTAYDADQHVLTIRTVLHRMQSDEPAQELELRLRVFSRPELRALLARHGFVVAREIGLVDGMGFVAEA